MNEKLEKRISKEMETKSIRSEYVETAYECELITTITPKIALNTLDNTFDSCVITESLCKELRRCCSTQPVIHFYTEYDEKGDLHVKYYQEREDSDNENYGELITPVEDISSIEIINKIMDVIHNSNTYAKTVIIDMPGTTDCSYDDENALKDALIKFSEFVSMHR